MNAITSKQGQAKLPRQHPYCYPGTDVLVNKRGHRVFKDLEAFERIASGERSLTLPRKIPITPSGYSAINKHLLQDVYDWAGQYRMVDTGRGDDHFCLAKHIDHQMFLRFAKIREAKNLKGLGKVDFARQAAEHINELNAIHPFLDGNGRTNRAFLKILGRQAGHWIDLARIPPDRWNSASRDGFVQEHERMADVIELAIVGPARDEPQLPLPPDEHKKSAAKASQRSSKERE